MSNDTLNATWVLDYKRSDSPDAVLSAQGVGWATRKVVCSLAITETLNFQSDHVQMIKLTKAQNSDDKLMHGVTEGVEDAFLGTVSQKVEVGDGNKTLTITMDNKEKETHCVTARSLIEENKTMKLQVDFTDKKGKTTSCTRYMTRKE